MKTHPRPTPYRYRRRSDDPVEILSQAGLTMSVPEAGVLFGLGESAARALARRGEFPVKVIRAGAQYRVATNDVKRLLALPVEPPSTEAASA